MDKGDCVVISMPMVPQAVIAMLSCVSGHRLSSGAIEEVIASHPDVAECAVVGVRDELKGQVPP